MKKIEPKILKGTRDMMPDDMLKRNLVINKIRSVFEKFGYNQIETPILNPAETILGKYGEEGDRLTYNFKDKGDRNLALPYDLTVPFARFTATNWRELPMPFKRYQIQRVWRAEKPQKGRLREFYQCDIDVIGTKSLIVEAEVAKVIVGVFREVGLEDIVIKFNSRKLINSILSSLDVPADKNLEVIRIIDKLEKIGPEKVEKMLIDMGIENSKEILQKLKPEDSYKKTLENLSDYDTSEIKEFLESVKDLGIDEKYLQFDPSLARGLDYYTGLVFEVVDKDGEYGSLCGGGRYDNLCSLFSNQEFSGMGVAFGLERIMLVLEEIDAFKNIQSRTRALITLFDENSVPDALKIYSDILDQNINCEMYFEPRKLDKQLKYADKKKIPFVVIQGPEEKEKNEVTVKNMESGEQESMTLDKLDEYLK
ncbi:MAG: histidine--tRNA ligase [Parcubacteria group bacterium]|nr:histidine--tRNA ligase [Parcubacteria group bacterium]